MEVPRRRGRSPRKPEPVDEDRIVHKDKDLRIPDATPWEVAQKLMQGGAPRRETRKDKSR